MKHYALMPLSEPTDKELINLMKEVARDAKEKALAEKKTMAKKIAQEIFKLSKK